MMKDAYNPNQPRAPKGSAAGGEWTGGAGGGGAGSKGRSPEAKSRAEATAAVYQAKADEYEKIAADLEKRGQAGFASNHRRLAKQYNIVAKHIAAGGDAIKLEELFRVLRAIGRGETAASQPRYRQTATGYAANARKLKR